MNRRTVIRTGLLATLGSTLRLRPGEAAAPVKERVIVVGAGMAGIAAASELRRRGFEVVVLEGRDRIGGRVYTDRSLGTPIDMGASWIHGMAGNPLTELARREKLRCALTDYDDVAVYDADGSRFPEERLEALEAAWGEIEDEVGTLADAAAKDMPVSDAITRALGGEALDPVEQRYLDWRMETMVVTAAASLSDLSLTGDEGESFDGEDCLFPGGYDRLVAGVAGDLDVKLGHAVTGIEVLRSGVRVHVAGATRGETCGQCHEQPASGKSLAAKGAEPRTFDAARVVVTLPLGVLKASIAGGGVAFDPPLPKGKRAAIERLAIGDLDKVALSFSSAFWPVERHFIGDLGGARGGFPVYLNYKRHVDAPVLVAFWAGKSGRGREESSNDALAAEAMGRLRKLFGRRIPDPVAVAASRWHTDPFSIGAYSFVPVGGGSDDYAAIAEPVGERLYFAGEATIVGHSGTVHGAYLSGLREAERIASSRR